MVKRLMLPKRRAGAPQQLVGSVTCEGFPTVQNRIERVRPQRLHDGVHMIGHRAPRMERITVALEKANSPIDQFRHTPVSQPGGTRVPIQDGIDF